MEVVNHWGNIIPFQDYGVKTGGFEEFATHPLYPLIGLEFEPQLTLLNYPNKAVYIFSKLGLRLPESESDEIIINPHEEFRHVSILLPSRFYQYIDLSISNLEFRTSPVSFAGLSDELHKLNQKFKEVILEIAEVVGPIGAFLPAAPCTKHVNISTANQPVMKALDTQGYKAGTYGWRKHIRVPYDYINYESLLPRMGTPKKQMTTPICLGYTYGKTWIELNQLK